MWLGCTQGIRNGTRRIGHIRYPFRGGTRTAARASPRVKAAQRRQQAVPNPKQKAPETQGPLKWPFNTINAAYKANKIPITPAIAIAVLDGFQELVQKSNWSQTNVEKVLQEHDVRPELLTTLAQMLLRVSGPSSHEFALNILLAASRLEDADATMMLVDETVKSGKVERLRSPKLRHPLRHLAKLGEKADMAGTVLLAKVTELEGDDEKALAMLETVIGQPLSHSSQTTKAAEKNLRSVYSEAWTIKARLKGKLGHSIEREKALKAAAEECDNPQAFYELSQLMDDKSSPQYVEYLQKAAISGVGNAAYYLGLLYSSQVEAKQDLIHTSGATIWARASILRAQELAKEWLSIASESSDCTRPGAAKLLLAWALRNMGDIEESKALLDQACDQLALNNDMRGSLTQHWTDSSLVHLSNELDNLARASELLV